LGERAVVLRDSRVVRCREVRLRDISTDAQFDDERYWRFARSSGLPVGYFGKRRTWRSHGIWIATAVAAFAALAILI
jgi:hypothetical protein